MARHQHPRHPGGRARHRPAGRHPHQPRRPLRRRRGERPVYELMTREGLVTVTRGRQPRARPADLLHRHRIEKLLVVDDAYRCVGLITVKDMEKAQTHPLANKDEQGRLRVAAATGVGAAGYVRAEALIEAGVDVIVVDTAHGHSRGVLEAVDAIKRESNAVQIIAGNVATGDGARGADRGRRRRDEGRHRPGLDLHHPDRGRRRRAAAHRGAGVVRPLPDHGRAGDRRWRHPHPRATSPRRSPPGPTA